MREAAPAKINLTLRIGARRHDGLHEVASLVVFADLADELEITPGDGLEVSGLCAANVPLGEANLAVKALRFLDRRAHIRLEKNVPPAAGLGGGSADAAAVLRALGGSGDLLKLGADVPACFVCRPVWMSGAGEKLKRLSALPPLWCVLICPAVHISTADMFAHWDEASGDRVNDISDEIRKDFSHAEDLFSFCACHRNDFEPLALERAPDVRRVLDLLRATRPAVAGMSGSGPACFGLYASAVEAHRAESALRQDSKDWIWRGKIRA